eukprot:TRINITY_DN12336_c0_g1_i1.p1 TRINITY_DN12336_c0_g1~~TRINITY_DN12336_c0_g1_i1.p1  ORF type:complete len:220 (+),score=81.89 TRINITY_DN12336_c0_g1_i1:80-661(+)
MAQARQLEVQRGDLGRELRREFPTIDAGVIDDFVEKILEGTSKDVVYDILREQAIERAQEEYDDGGDDDETARTVMVYSTSQTGDRTVRGHCKSLRLCLDALRIPYEEVDIAENKWLRKKLTDAAGGQDVLPLCFVGVGPDAEFVGTWPQISDIVDEGKIFDHLEERGYRHKGERPRQIIFSHEDDDEEEEDS